MFRRRFRNQVPPGDEIRPHLSLVPLDGGDNRWMPPTGTPPPGQYKTLVEWRGAIELGMFLYPYKYDDVTVYKAEEPTVGARYALSRTIYTADFRSVLVQRERTYPPGVERVSDGDPNAFPRRIHDIYPSFEALLADWPGLVGQSIWSPKKTTLRQRWEDEYIADLLEDEGSSLPGEAYVFPIQIQLS